jgi:hypothetical protein
MKELGELIDEAIPFTREHWVPLVLLDMGDAKYLNHTLRYLAGKQDADATVSSLGTLGNPQDTYIPVLASEEDLKEFSYVFKNGVRMLVAKIDTPTAGQTSLPVRWSLIAVPKTPFQTWATLTRDIKFKLSADGPLITGNPNGVAQVGDDLYIIDYDSKKIYIVGVNEINGLPHGSEYVLTKTPIDLSTFVTQDNAKGQAIIAHKDGDGKDCLFALYLNYDSEEKEHSNGILVRLKKNTAGTAFVPDVKTLVGKNPQEIIAVTLSTGVVHLLVPAIGGEQNATLSNFENSTITSVPAFDTAWPTAAIPRLTGNLVSSSGGAPSGDFRAIASTHRADNLGNVYIMLSRFDKADFSEIIYQIYRTSVALLLNGMGQSVDDAVAAGILTPVESGTVISPPPVDGSPYGIYYSNILYVGGDEPRNDLLIVFRGSEMLVTLPDAYGSPQVESGNPYRVFAIGNHEGDLGGENVNSIEVLVEALRQALAGTSGKRGVRPMRIQIADEDSDKK